MNAGANNENLLNIESLLDAGHAVRFAPQGWSMYPLISDGRDQVIVVPAEGHRLRRGDVALYRRDGSILVLHRVWKVTEDGIWFVGDNQRNPEGPLRRDQVRGVMSAVVRKGKTIPVTNAGYILYSRLWLLARPLRPSLSRIAAAIKRL